MPTFQEVMLQRVKAQEPMLPKMKGAPVFYRNLEAMLDERRKDNRLLMMNVPRDTIDFSSNDFISLSSSGMLKKQFFEELALHPDFVVGQSGSRLVDGNTVYCEQLENDMAAWMNSEACLLFNSGYDANSAIFSVLPQFGDCIVYDALVHASILDGMEISRCTNQRMFLHNDLVSFRAVMEQLKKDDAGIRDGKHSVLIAVESVYSMDGNCAPILELMEIAKEVYPLGNVQYFFDEAHSTGLMGPNGRGMACELGIETQMATRLHTFGKGLGCNGAVVMCNETCRNMMVNFARGLIFTAGPSFPFLAAMRAAFVLLRDGHAEAPRAQLQANLRYFYKSIFNHPSWKTAYEAGILSIPEGETYETQKTLLQIVPIWTNARDNHHLAAHLHLADFKAFPVDYPVVPKGEGRMRLVFHAGNTIEQIDGIVDIIMTWAEEMVEFKGHGKALTCTWSKLVAVEEARKAKLYAKKDEGKEIRAQLTIEAQAYSEKSQL